MERAAIITRLALAPSNTYLLLNMVSDLPDSESLSTYFTEVPLMLEQADIKEILTDTDQGELVEYNIRANTPRESVIHLQFAGTFVLAYIETANGERHLIGTNQVPLQFAYTRDTGAGNGDNRNTSLSLSLSRKL
jgi:hypothetical protein